MKISKNQICYAMFKEFKQIYESLRFDRQIEDDDNINQIDIEYNYLNQINFAFKSNDTLHAAFLLGCFASYSYAVDTIGKKEKLSSKVNITKILESIARCQEKSFNTLIAKWKTLAAKTGEWKNTFSYIVTLEQIKLAAQDYISKMYKKPNFLTYVQNKTNVKLKINKKIYDSDPTYLFSYKGKDFFVSDRIVYYE